MPPSVGLVNSPTKNSSTTASGYRALTSDQKLSLKKARISLHNVIARMKQLNPSLPMVMKVHEKAVEIYGMINKFLISDCQEYFKTREQLYIRSLCLLRDDLKTFANA
ncbi:unnamed protein product [Caenorhabditis sp. 36 PRJEB53466]|nr:unnamed protein product [Caenorhabditis sp. 36 PRJEB53466]